MGQPYVGEIRMFAGNFAPAGWMFCDGQLLPISENETLFQLIGTTYGGDGQSTFALPDLRSRLPMHPGNGHIQAETGGAESVTLTTNQIPVHNHPVLATSNVGTQSSPVNNYFAAAGVQLYADPPVASPIGMKNTLVGQMGGSQPHENMAPYLAISFIISLFGIFPSQT
jgi:microcystin-dependent protein